MPPQLAALTEGPDIVVDKPILLIGRHEECDIQIPSRKISRRHCCLAQIDDQLFIKDLFSTNGIRINGIRVPEGTLQPGDELTIGNFKYAVKWERPPAQNLQPQAIQAESPDIPDLPMESGEEPIALRGDMASNAPPGLPLVLPVRKEPALPKNLPNLEL